MSNEVEGKRSEARTCVLTSRILGQEDVGRVGRRRGGVRERDEGEGSDEEGEEVARHGVDAG